MACKKMLLTKFGVTWRDVRFESVMRAKADVGRLLRIRRFTPCC
jgi:hypothetical protein